MEEGFCEDEVAPQAPGCPVVTGLAPAVALLAALTLETSGPQPLVVPTALSNGITFTPPMRIKDLPPPRDQPGSCKEQAATTPSDVEGVVELRIESSCRKDRAVEVRTEDTTLDARFDAAGKLRVLVPLFRDASLLRWEDSDGQVHEERVAFSRAARTFRLVLVWSGPVALSLLIKEAAAVMGSRCQIARRGDPCQSTGRFAALPPPDADGQNFEIYDLPASAFTRKGLLPFQIAFDPRVVGPTRDRKDYCGQGILAAPSFAVWVFKNGSLTKQAKQGFESTPCTDGPMEPLVFRGRDVPIP